MIQANSCLPASIASSAGSAQPPRPRKPIFSDRPGISRPRSEDPGDPGLRAFALRDQRRRAEVVDAQLGPVAARDPCFEALAALLVDPGPWGQDGLLGRGQGEAQAQASGTAAVVHALVEFDEVHLVD